MAKAFTAQAGDQISRYLNDIGDRAGPLFRGSRTDLVKRFGPFGLAAAALAGGYALTRHFLGRTRPEPAPEVSTPPKAAKRKKGKSKKQG
jgi:hypothetical protein